MGRIRAGRLDTEREGAGHPAPHTRVRCPPRATAPRPGPPENGRSPRAAVGDAQRGRLRAQRAAGADEHAALGQPAHDLRLVALAQRDPAEVGLRVGGLQAEPAQALGDRGALGDGAGHPFDDRVLVGQRLDRRDLGERVAEERLADLIDRPGQIV